MRLGGEPVGRWGIALLAVTGLAGVGLAVHGWSARGSGITPALAGSSRAAASAPAASSPAQTGPSGGASPSAPAAAGVGPKLSSEPYAKVAFQIWPGTPSAAAKQALTGLRVSVRKQGAGISVTAGAAGQPAGAPRFYPAGARVYVIEASMGDDSGNSDYSLGDDGLAVTNSQGRIVQ
jgi:hypothetical protein